LRWIPVDYMHLEVVRKAAAANGDVGTVARSPKKRRRGVGVGEGVEQDEFGAGGNRASPRRRTEGVALSPPLSNLRKSSYRGRRVLVRSGRHGGRVGTAESTVDGQWVLVSGLYDDDADMEVLVPSGVLELLPHFSADPPPASEAEENADAPAGSSATAQEGWMACGPKSAEVEDGAGEPTGLDGFVLKSVRLPIATLLLRKGSILAVQRELEEQIEDLERRHDGGCRETLKSLGRRLNRADVELETLDADVREQLGVAAMLRKRFLMKMGAAAVAVEEASAAFDQQEVEMLDNTAV